MLRRPSCVACRCAYATCAGESERSMFLSPVGHMRICQRVHVMCAHLLENQCLAVLSVCAFGECHVSLTPSYHAAEDGESTGPARSSLASQRSPCCTGFGRFSVDRSA